MDVFYWNSSGDAELIVQMLILSDPQASALTDQSQSWIWSNFIVLSLTMEQIIKCFHSGFILP